MEKRAEVVLIDSLIDQVKQDGFAGTLLEILGFGVVIVEADRHEIVYVNPKVCEMSGFAAEEVIGKSCHRLLCPAQYGKCPITHLGQAVDNSERTMLCKYGQPRSIIKTVVPFSIGDQHYYIESLIDNSDRCKMQEQLAQTNHNLEAEIVRRQSIQEEIEKLAYYDFLTQLPNRMQFIEHLNHAITMSTRTASMTAVMFMDLDGFKMINDTMGHATGDKLLVQVARRLESNLRKSDVIARIGGDEFIIMIENVYDLEAIKTVADKVLRSFDQPFLLEQQECYLSTSIGIAEYPTDGEDAEALIKNADIAMYRAKEKGKNQYVFCTPYMKMNLAENMRLSNQLYRAIDNNELELYYQPQVNCATNEIIGLEALLRWNHPQQGMISPGVFIPIAEQTGLIVSIGEWVLHTACLQNKAWQDAGLPSIRMAVNISVRQLQTPNIVEKVAQILSATGLRPDYLELEITENTIMKEHNVVISTLAALKIMGIRIAIDDFGTEYSSLAYIKNLPVDRIKIAMPFIHGIDVSHKDEAIVKAIIVLARSLDLDVIAEGVETSKQLKFLSHRMCEQIQGYYYYRPMPTGEVEQLLRQQINPSRSLTAAGQAS